MKVTKSNQDLIVECVEHTTYTTKGQHYSAFRELADVAGDEEREVLCIAIDDGASSFVVPGGAEKYFKLMECTPEERENFMQFEQLLYEDLVGSQE